MEVIRPEDFCRKYLIGAIICSIKSNPGDSNHVRLCNGMREISPMHIESTSITEHLSVSFLQHKKILETISL